MMLQSLKILPRKQSFKHTSLYYNHLNESWISTNGEKAVHIKPSELKNHYTWHNTLVLCPPSVASEQPEDSDADLLSLTHHASTTIYDYGPSPTYAKLGFTPSSMIGTIGLATIALSSHKRADDEFILLLLKDRLILNQYKGNNLKKVRSIKLRQTDNITSLLSTLIPKLIQAGIRLGQSKCLLVYIKSEFTAKTIEGIQKPLSLKKSDLVTIPSFAELVMTAWWQQTTKPQPAIQPYNLPKLGTLWLIIAAMILVTIKAIDASLPNPIETSTKAAVSNQGIVGALNASGRNAKQGATKELLALKEIPSDSWLTNFMWRPQPKVFIEGFSRKQVNAYKIQESMSQSMHLPMKELQLKFYGISSNGEVRWSLGEKLRS